MNYFILLFILSVAHVAARKFYRTETEEKIRHLEISAQLMKNLLTDYEPWLRPEPNVNENSASVQVRVNFSISDYKFDYDKSILKLNTLFNQQWTDKRLHYAPRVPYLILAEDKKIWVPDTVIIGTESVVTQSENELAIRIYPSGNIFFSQKLLLYVDCRKNYSRNVLKIVLHCSYVISTFSHTTQDIVYSWSTNRSSLSDLEVENDLELIDIREEYCKRETNTGNYSCLKFSIILQGFYLHSLVYIYIPSLLFVILSWLHFWIPHNRNVPRMLTALIPFLIFSLIMITRKSEHTKNFSPLDTWFMFCTLFTFCSFIQYIILVRVSKKQSKKSDVSETFLFQENNTLNERNRSVQKKNKNKLDLISKILFLLLFISFLIFYILYYCIYGD